MDASGLCTRRTGYFTTVFSITVARCTPLITTRHDMKAFFFVFKLSSSGRRCRSTNDFVACSHELTHVHNLSCSSCTALWTPWWVSQRVDDTDDQLFSAVLTNSHHVLHHMLPDRTSYPYTLRPRRHDCSLIKEDARNFIILLFSVLWYIS